MALKKTKTLIISMILAAGMIFTLACAGNVSADGNETKTGAETESKAGPEQENAVAEIDAEEYSDYDVAESYPAYAETFEESQITMAEIMEMNGGAVPVSINEGCVTFIGGTATTEKITKVEDAFSLLYRLVKLMGGDESTRFYPWVVLKDNNENIYYVFQQIHDDVTVSGGAVKIVTDPEGNMTGFFSSLVRDLPDSDQTIMISEADAIQTVMDDSGYPKGSLSVIEGASSIIVLPAWYTASEGEEVNGDANRFVWVIYTNNPDAAYSTQDYYPVLAHYVTMDGLYLYALPSRDAGDEASKSGFSSTRVFEYMESVPWSGSVALHDGTEMNIEMDIMRDKRDGTYYLGNLERRILVADYYDFAFKDTLMAEDSSDGKTWSDDNSVITLYNLCRVWDYYNEMGWKGADGNGTPIVVLTGLCDEYREPIDNAAYLGKYGGWQVFAFSDISNDAEALDVVGHEFTHCVTESTMTYNLYMNDPGAINEAMSDIMGNLCEIKYEGENESNWLVGEKSGRPVRSMYDPQKFSQPCYTWDIYYVPHVSVPNEMNDYGGVHSNSSLLNRVAYGLYKDGKMTPEEAADFWMAVSCSIVPGTDYSQLSIILPWVMESIGMEKYLPILRQYITETRLSTLSIPDEFPKDQALLSLKLPENIVYNDSTWVLVAMQVDHNVWDILMNAVPEDYADIQEFYEYLDSLNDQLMIQYIAAPGIDGKTIRLIVRPEETQLMLIRLNPQDLNDIDYSMIYTYADGAWTKEESPDDASILITPEAGKLTIIPTRGL